MKITKISNTTSEELAQAVLREFNNSRFDIYVEYNHKLVNIQQVRLRSSKEFCGNHPKACEGDPNRKHRKRRHLEGADWVEFNDTLNALLDRLGVCADVASAQVQLRIGVCRRIDYREDKLLGVPGQNAAWTWLKFGAEEHYENHVGKQAPPSAFPKGTPGIYSRIGYFVEG